MAVQSTTTFVGRDAELALIGELLAGAVAGRGRAVLIEGEPGIGKSALVSAGLTGADTAKCRVLRGRCDELAQRFPLSSLTQALGLGPDESPTGPRRAVTTHVLRSPVAATSPGVRTAAEDPVTTAIEQLLGLVDRLCASGPVVLAVEDLHWADEASLLLWGRLCSATARLPLLLVATCRPVPVRPALDALRRELRESGGAFIPLDGLPQPAVAKLAAERLGGAPGPRLSRRLASAAGNPLYVGELLEALVRSEAVRTVTDGVELVADAPRDAEMSPPHVNADRLDFLSAPTRAVLRTAALLGPDFSVAELATVVGRPRADLVDAVDEAMAAGVVEADGAKAGGERLHFRHGLLRRSLYESTPTALLAALHQHAAKALIAAGAPVERVAPLVLPVLAEPEGWEVGWIAANAGALAARSPESAAHLLGHALERLDTTDPGHADVEDQYLAVTFRLGRDQQSEATSRAVMAGGADPERAGRAAWFLGSTLLRTGRREEASTVLAVAADAGGAETGVPQWRVRNEALRSTALVGLVGQVGQEEACQAAERAYAEGQRLGDPLARAQALYTRSVVRTLSDDFAEALAVTDEILSLTDAHDELLDLGLTVQGDRSAVLAELDRFTEAEATAREALASAARAASIRPGAVVALRTRVAELHYTQGRWNDALTALELPTEEPELVRMSCAAHALRALIAGHRDDWQEASRQLAALGDRRVLDEQTLNSASIVRAWALEAEHVARPERVVEVLAPCLTPDAGQRVIGPSACLPLLVRAAQECGDMATLRAAAQVCAATGERHAARQADLDWCRGLLAGEPAPVLAAASSYRASGRRAALGNALEDAAVVQAACGDVTAARTTLAEALDVYSALGAAWDTRRVTARLRPYGVRPGVRGTRQRPKNGWQALTDTERRVAELVAQGLSNPDIAGQLLLSRRTVETHVSHILTKLQISSRREVARQVRHGGA
ncbi:ATP-binding protein [Streptomyces pseudovenezuelae]|uniref:DNA-binding CsgD family transcriptional regulator n=1 Tax=Streptomyces pseudovenezuelae TaxID=67350 RepID=A0ABT6LR91_9ACTN|nr:LuxR family transcriptional regulator [Streptomyces pseudovenezuelae]MDH6217889.1 DNA-binding CsgD family transcriptional regulator [Streptomyces pseudovenezuelae]